MSFARDIIRDLVEKRLWPVALLMVAAIAAILLMGGGASSSGPGADAVPIAPADAATASSAVELLGPPSVRQRAGKVVDPFRRSAKDDAQGGAGSAETSAPVAAASGGTSAGTGESDESQDKKSTVDKSTGSAYLATARVGSSGSAAEGSLNRLAPLGGSDDPALLYLGVYSDGKRALFVLGPNATAQSDGDCMDGVECRVIGLRKGESATVTVSALTYALDVESVGRFTLSAKDAAAARADEASGGREVLRELLEHGPTANALGGLRYSLDRGVVTRA